MEISEALRDEWVDSYPAFARGREAESRTVPTLSQYLDSMENWAEMYETRSSEQSQNMSLREWVRARLAAHERLTGPMYATVISPAESVAKQSAERATAAADRSITDADLAQAYANVVALIAKNNPIRQIVEASEEAQAAAKRALGAAENVRRIATIAKSAADRATDAAESQSDSDVAKASAEAASDAHGQAVSAAEDVTTALRQTVLAYNHAIAYTRF